MTTIITRLFSDVATAQAVARALISAGHDPDLIHVITDGSVAAMKAAGVGSARAAVYAGAMTQGQGMLVVDAPFNPIGTARRAMKIVGRTPSVDVGIEDETEYTQSYPDLPVEGSILTTHPLVMSNPFRTASHGHIFGQNPVIQSRPRTSAIRGGAYMSKMFWPMKLVSTPARKSSAISGGMLVSSLFGLKTILRR